MQKKIREAIFREFSKQMSQRLPVYRQVDSPYEGELVFSRESTTPKLDIFVCIVPNPKGGNSFTLELAWSKLQRFPAVMMKPSTFVTNERSEFSLDEAIVRIGVLYSSLDQWWEPRGSSQGEALEREIFGKVTEVMQKVERYVEPYFAELEEYVSNSATG